MNDVLNRLLSYLKGEKATLAELTVQNVTPEWIDTLKENEIFVFGCRNSGMRQSLQTSVCHKSFGIYSTEECSSKGNGI